jgi:hypothetical protein
LIEIPEGVTTIGKGVFHQCKSLESIVIPRTEDNMIHSSMDPTQAILAAARTVLLVEELSSLTKQWGGSSRGKARNKDPLYNMIR